MDLRLRQICLVARDLAPAIDALKHVLGLEVCYIDSAVGEYGLENSLLPVGNQFLEVVAPTRPGTAGGRYLDRRGGDGGYMVITQCADREARDARLAELQVPIANTMDYGTFHGHQLHPKYTGGAFFEIDWNTGGEREDGPWHPAGPDWKPHVRTDTVRAITTVELQSPDPAGLADRWSHIAGIALTPGEAGPELPFTNARLRFVEARDGRGEGLGGIDLAATNASAIAAACQRARAAGHPVTDTTATLCGTRIRLVPQ
jgi:hypothetical protein